MNKIKRIKYVVFLLIAITFVTLLLTTGLVGVSGVSMYPTLRNGDLLFICKTKDVTYNDIVVLNSDDLGVDIVKRVIGLPGDKIVINKKGLFRNDTVVAEPFDVEADWYKKSASVNTTVPEDTIFVLGDNRAESYDSRELGNIPESDLVGKYMVNLSDYTGLSTFGFKVLGIVLGMVILFVVSLCHKKLPKADLSVEIDTTKFEKKPEPTPVEVPTTSMINKHQVTPKYWEDSGSDVDLTLQCKE